MGIRYPGVVLMSAAMALHAAIAGRYLESVFFLIAFCWAWVAVTALRDRLQSAQSMVLTMLGLLVLIVLPVTVLRLSGQSLVAHMSLAVMPSIIAWACMLLYLRHVKLQEESGADINRVEAEEWLADLPAITASEAKSEAASFAMPALSSAVAPSAPVVALPVHPPQPIADNDSLPDAADLTVERVAEIIASLRGAAPAQQAA